MGERLQTDGGTASREVDARLIIEELHLDGDMGATPAEAEAFARRVCQRLSERLGDLQGRRAQAILTGTVPAQAVHIPLLSARVGRGVGPNEVADALAERVRARGRWT